MASDVRKTNAWKSFQYSHASPAQPRFSASAVDGQPRDGSADEDVLEDRLQLAARTRRDDRAVARGDGADDRDSKLAAEHDQQDPERATRQWRRTGRGVTALRQDVERDERRREQQLVGDRIDELAEVRDPAVLPRQVAVPQVGERGDQEEDPGDEPRRERRHEEQQPDDGRENDAPDGDGVRERAPLEERPARSAQRLEDELADRLQRVEHAGALHRHRLVLLQAHGIELASQLLDRQRARQVTLVPLQHDGQLRGS
jgi:hypothetical protein